MALRDGQNAELGEVLDQEPVQSVQLFFDLSYLCLQVDIRGCSRTRSIRRWGATARGANSVHMLFDKTVEDACRMSKEIEVEYTF